MPCLSGLLTVALFDLISPSLSRNTAFRLSPRCRRRPRSASRTATGPPCAIRPPLHARSLGGDHSVEPLHLLLGELQIDRVAARLGRGVGLAHAVDGGGALVSRQLGRDAIAHFLTRGDQTFLHEVVGARRASKTRAQNVDDKTEAHRSHRSSPRSPPLPAAPTRQYRDLSKVSLLMDAPRTGVR